MEINDQTNQTIIKLTETNMEKKNS